MVARKRSAEKKKAKGQYIQKAVHEILYCDTDSEEHLKYTQRLERISSRSNLSPLNFEIDRDVVNEFDKRVRRLLTGKDAINKSLVFYRILTSLEKEPLSEEALIHTLEDYSMDCCKKNLKAMVLSGFLEQNQDIYKLSGKGKKLYRHSK